jgi:broad specificity phosphatase PhoE
MNRVYLVRHGENPANLTKEFSCRKVDYSLTEKGRLQAAQTADYFAGRKIDELFSSPLKRAMETAREIALKTGKPFAVLEEFREIDVGDIEDIPPDRGSWVLYGKVVKEWLAGNSDCSFPNGENRTMLLERFRRGIRKAVEGKDGKRIVIVGHGGIFTTGVADLCGIEDQRGFLSIESYNCSISELEVDIGEKGLEAKLNAWGDIGHLSGIARQLVESVPESARVKNLL